MPGTAPKGCSIQAQSYSFRSSKVDHFAFCFTLTMQPPAGIILGLPPPARTPTTNLPVRSCSGSMWSPALVFHWLSPRCPLSLLLSCISFSSSCPRPPSSSQQFSFFSASFSAGSCPTTLRADVSIFGNCHFQLYPDTPDGSLSLWNWPHSYCKFECSFSFK